MIREHGPERRGGQGLDPDQYESGDRTILALLAETPAADQVDLVATRFVRGLVAARDDSLPALCR